MAAGNVAQNNAGSKMRCIFTWSVSYFSYYFNAQDCGDNIFSPIFCADESTKTKWLISICPNGRTDFEDYVSVDLIRFSAERDLCSMKLKCKISIMDVNSKVWCSAEIKQNVGESLRFQFNTFVKRSKLLEENVKALPGDTLTISCQICAYDENDFEQKSRKQFEVPRNGLKNLSEDLKTLYDTGKFSDVTLRMNSENIPSHKAILCARSSVFSERLRACPSSESINVPNFEKDTIDALLAFMYSGKIDAKSDTFPFALHEAAERYDIEYLCSSLTPRKIFARTEIMTEKYSFTWRLRNFSFIKECCCRIVYSDIFHTEPSCGKWNLSLYFHKSRMDDDENIGIYLNKLWTTTAQESTVYIHFKIHMLDEKQIPCYTMHMKQCFKPSSRHGFPFFTRRSFLSEEDSGILQSDTMIVRCDLKIYNGQYLSTMESSYSSASTNPLQRSEVKHLSESFRELLSNKTVSDITVRSADRSFFLHKTILCARSTVFAELLKDIDNKLHPCTVDIPDIKPLILDSLFTFMYTGELDDLRVETAPELYNAAYSYNIRDLKNICSKFLKANVTISNACEIMALSHALNDQVLIKSVKDFICENADEMVMSSKWQDFVKEHSDLSTEILKSLSNGYCRSKRRRLNNLKI